MAAEKKLEEFKERAKALVSEMTLEEKVFQTLHSAPAIERLGVKAYNYWNEALHGVARAGVATVFPQAIGLAASFDPELVYEVADTISTEGRGKFETQQKYGDTDIYKGLTFWSPNVNIFRDPRWGRGHETFGEDPYLSGLLGTQFVRGIQGEDDTYLKAAACAKHFAVHSGPEHLRHSFNAEVSEQDLRETYLPAFQTLVKEAGVEAVMGAYNRTNGEPCCGSKRLLVDILRGEWEFQGHVTSDCWAIKDFYQFHKVTRDEEESVTLAMNMGCDLNCGTMYVHLLQAVRDGLVEEETLDRALVRLFTTRMKLGLFDDPEQIPYSKITYKDVNTKKNQELNLKAARESLVLLKNEGNLLPLDKKKLKTIGIIGPNADNRRALVGNYEGTASRYVTVLEGIEDYLSNEDVRIFYSEGCHLYKNAISNLSTGNDRLSEVRAVCEHSDIVVACLGLDSGLEGEEGDAGDEFGSGDKPNLQLPGLQEEILKEMYACGKPVILVLLSGSALAVSWAEQKIPAIVQGWYPGAFGGRAIAELLFGEFSPEGKLPVTFYRTSEELPEFTDYSMKHRTYRYMEQEALFPFGYGLSYVPVSQTVEQLSANTIAKGERITATVRLKNEGKQSCGTTIQAYVKYYGEDAPNFQLKGLKKVHLLPGEEQLVTITLSDRAFGLYDTKGDFKLNQGNYDIFLGDSAPDNRSSKLTGKQPYCARITCAETQMLSD